MPMTRAEKVEAAALLNHHLRDDLRYAYMATFDDFAVHPSDLVRDNMNSRYIRELLGTLEHYSLIALQDVNGADVYQVINPGTYDEATRDEAERIIDEFLDSHVKPDPAVPSPVTSTSSTPRKANNVPTSNATNGFRKCLCGCDENVAGKSLYRPGHDARHAGAVARQVAATKSEKVATKALASLGSDRLRIKASSMADRIIAKAGK